MTFERFRPIEVQGRQCCDCQKKIAWHKDAAAGIPVRCYDCMTMYRMKHKRK